MTKTILAIISFSLVALIFTSQTYPTYANPAYEDFTTWTEVDVGADRLTVTTNNVDAFSYNNEETYVYGDYEVDFFDDFTHHFDVLCDAGSGASVSAPPWGLGNVIDDSWGYRAASETAILIKYYWTSGSLIRIYLQELHAGSVYSTFFGFTTEDVWLYFAVVKANTALTVEVYSSAALRTTGGSGDTGSLSLTLQADHTFRYAFVAWSNNNGDNEWIDISVRNLDVEVLPPDNTFPTYSLMGLNSTLNASGIQFTINLSDNIELDTCLLEWNNTGSLGNVSFGLSGTNYLLLANQTLHAMEAVRIYYRFFFNDSSGNMNVTIQHFLITNTEPIIGPPPEGLSSAQYFVGLMVILVGIGFIGYLLRKN